MTDYGEVVSGQESPRHLAQILCLLSDQEGKFIPGCSGYGS